MFLEVVTLILLTLVLLSKWWTARHTQKLSLELIELQTSHSKLKADHGALYAQRQTAEAQLKDLESEKTKTEARLEELKDDLNDQLDRNEDIEDK